MTRVSVATQPQSIYPYGQQEAVTIVNEGPWTVFLDSDSSVSEASYPLPPTGTIVWAEEKPLWAVAPGGDQFKVAGDPNYSPSVLTMTRNSYQGVAPRAGTVDRLFKRQGVNLPADSTFTFPTIETASYNTLFLQYNSADSGAGGGIPATDRSFELFVNWTDQNGRTVGNDKYVSPSTSSLNLERGVIITVPVRGARVDVIFTYRDDTPPATSLFSFEVYGSSRIVRDRQDWMVGQLPSDYANAQSFNGAGDQASYSGYYKQTNWDRDYEPIFLNGIGNDIQLIVSYQGAVTTQGRIHVRSYYDPSILFANLVVPVFGFSQQVVSNVIIPISTPVQIVPATGATPATTNPVHIGIVWKDYNG